mmetsp:Transcript_60884/g.199359  ORF Transcript_60884/g.199359 Transcript_60884/m.199359 type:complete len:261 (+) Transcript_60884:351-1133(+)
MCTKQVWYKLATPGHRGQDREHPQTRRGQDDAKCIGITKGVAPTQLHAEPSADTTPMPGHRRAADSGDGTSQGAAANKSEQAPRYRRVSVRPVGGAGEISKQRQSKSSTPTATHMARRGSERDGGRRICGRITTTAIDGDIRVPLRIRGVRSCAKGSSPNWVLQLHHLSLLSLTRAAVASKHVGVLFRLAKPSGMVRGGPAGATAQVLVAVIYSVHIEGQRLACVPTVDDCECSHNYVHKVVPWDGTRPGMVELFTDVFF